MWSGYREVGRMDPIGSPYPALSRLTGVKLAIAKLTRPRFLEDRADPGEVVGGGFGIGGRHAPNLRDLGLRMTWGSSSERLLHPVAPDRVVR